MGSKLDKLVKNGLQKQGDHTVRIYRRFGREFSSRDSMMDRFQKQTREKIDKLDSRVPTFDSGYFFINNTSDGDYSTENDFSSVEIEHNLKQVPMLVQMFFSTKEEPKFGRDDIYVITSHRASNRGLTLHFTDGNTMVVSTGNTTIQGTNTKGYLRILLWS